MVYTNQTSITNTCLEMGWCIHIKTNNALDNEHYFGGSKYKSTIEKLKYRNVTDKCIIQ